MEHPPPSENEPENGVSSGDGAVTPPTQPPADLLPPRRRGYGLVAWIFILLLAGLLSVIRSFAPQVEGPTDDAGIAGPVFQMQAKYLVGAKSFPGVTGEQLYSESQQLNTGPLALRLRYIALAGELAGAEAALEQLDELQEKIEEHRPATTETQRKLLDILPQLYRDYLNEEWKAPSLSDSQKELLRRQLDWFGALALAPEEGDPQAREAVMQPAYRTFYTLVVALIGVLMLIGLGVVALVVVCVLMAAGKIPSRLNAGSNWGGVYAETFAVWFFLFIVLQIVAGFLLRNAPAGPATFIVFFGSLVALAWPVLRGAKWRQVRQEVGLHRGRGWLVEAACGVLAYLATLPLMLVGALLMMILMFLVTQLTGAPGGSPFGSPDMPTHPIVEWIKEASWVERLMVVALACIAAPVVEETVFRGLLYRQLRDATAKARTVTSVLFSGLAVSLLFAAIHPQGFVAIPPLMALAFGFSVAREVRGSLVAPMVAHGMNNGILTIILVTVM